MHIASHAVSAPRRPGLPAAAGLIVVLALMLSGPRAASAQTGSRPEATTPATSGALVPGAIVPPPGYVIGPDDVLGVLFWREKELSTDVTVRPDGMITLPLVNDIEAAGTTPEQLRERITEASTRFVEDPSVTVVVREIRSRKVFITGQVAKPGQYLLTGPTTVMQLIAMAGGLHEFADGKNILIMRTEAGRPVAHRFNYREVLSRRNLRQNIELNPGDTVVIP